MATQNLSEYLLPATRYEAPPRPVRKPKLNTIIEDKYAENEEEYMGMARGRGVNRDEQDRLGAQRSAKSTSPVPSLTSSISSYYKNRRYSSDFDDLYDMSDDDSDIAPSVMTSSMSTRSVSPNLVSLDKPTKNRLPSLVIPSPHFWPTVQQSQNGSPPRPPKIPLSPAVLSMLGQDLPRQSNTPSLVSSQNTDPFMGQSAPATPDMPSSGDLWDQHEYKNAESKQKNLRPVIRIRTDEEILSPQGLGLSPAHGISVRDFGSEVGQDCFDSPILGSENGVELPADALRTLQHLSLEASNAFLADEEPQNEMQERSNAPSQTSSAIAAPTSALTEYSISSLSIPSPGGFFSSLGGNARHTWCVKGSAPVSALPPSSTTAENFYNCPWTRELSNPIEQIIEVRDAESEGPPTARQVPPTASTVIPVEYVAQKSPRFAADEIMNLQEEDYEQAIQESADQSLDRTASWLAEQTSYMAALRETNPVNDLSAETSEQSKTLGAHERNNSLGSPIRKAVKFLETEAAKQEGSTSLEKTGQESSIYYEAFQHISADQTPSDAFTHQHARSDSLQSIRVCLPQEHVSLLQGNFHLTSVERPIQHRPISMMPGKLPADSEESPEQKMITRVEQERQALDQVNPRMWMIEATKFLNGGQLIKSPALRVITKAAGNSSPQILDLAGSPNGDWAWHCSRDFPHAKVHTATPDSHILESAVSGPLNHKPAAMDAPWKLPYPDNHFEVISARSLYAYLKVEKPCGENGDEYDLCLQECLRCLKPGGYLEFFVLDSEILNAGSRATAVSVEFGFNLKTRGYDPCPTKSFLGRLRRNGFEDIKRAWSVLPMGSPTMGAAHYPETPPPDASTFEEHVEHLEAVRGALGSTADVANLTGLVGSWAWESWMLRLQSEMGKKTLLEGVGAALEEGKKTGAGWRCLSGWARKPL